MTAWTNKDAPCSQVLEMINSNEPHSELLVAQQPVASMLSHAEFAAQNDAVTAKGSLAPGYWVGTVANVNGNVLAMNSMTFYGNQAANANATLALRSMLP